MSGIVLLKHPVFDGARAQSQNACWKWKVSKNLFPPPKCIRPFFVPIWILWIFRLSTAAHATRTTSCDCMCFAACARHRRVRGNSRHLRRRPVHQHPRGVPLPVLRRLHGLHQHEDVYRWAPSGTPLPVLNLCDLIREVASGPPQGSTTLSWVVSSSGQMWTSATWTQTSASTATARTQRAPSSATASWDTLSRRDPRAAQVHTLTHSRTHTEFWEEIDKKVGIKLVPILSYLIKNLTVVKLFQLLIKLMWLVTFYLHFHYFSKFWINVL